MVAPRFGPAHPCNAANTTPIPAAAYSDESRTLVTGALRGSELLDCMVRVQKGTLRIFENATALGRHEVALKAIREVRANTEVIAKMQAWAESGLNSLALCKLTAEDLNFVLRHTLAELPTRDREALILEDPQLGGSAARRIRS